MKAIADLAPIGLVVMKATAVLLVALGLTALMPRASATSRHLVWMASLLALIAIPLLTLWSPVRLAVLPASWNVSSVIPAASVLGTESATASRDALRQTGEVEQPSAAGARSAGMVAPRISDDEAAAARSTAGASVVATAEHRVAERALISPIALIGSVWAAVAFALLAWLAYGAVSVRRIVRAATPLVDATWQSAMIDIADRLELDSTPRLMRGVGVTMPFACGLRTPTIVLPEDCDGWSAERRAAVLLHELAHIRRRDIVGHTLGRVACAAYWFHPLAWMAARRLRGESERACDDLALGCGTRASDYAEHLLDIVTSVRNHGTPSVAMAMATRSEFEGRMLAILDPHLSRTAPTRLQASTLAGGVMMFAIVTGSAVPKNATPQSPQAASQQSATATDTVLVSDTHSARQLHTQTDSIVAQQTEMQSVMHTDHSLEANVNVQGMPLSKALPIAAPSPAAKTEPAAKPEPDVNALAVRAVPSVRIGRVSPADSSARASVLAKILRSDTASSLRRIAAWGLRDFTDNDAALSALLDAARRDASADVREMSAWALSDAADHANVATALAEILRTEKDQRVREVAIWSLGNGGNSGSAETIGALTTALGDADDKVREMAAWGIGNSSPRKAPAALMTALGDRSARVRATAAWALFEIRDEDAASQIESALLKEMDPQAKWAMVRAISVMGERAVAPLQRLLEGSDPAARALAIRTLAGRGGDPWPQPRPRPRPFP
jgi:beta-lactamase regulating signal transducer with metallopeptidase domain/HEAT repeat protein